MMRISTRLALSPARACIAAGLAGLALAVTALTPQQSHWWASVILAMALAWLAMIDHERLLLPDVLTLGLLVVGLAVAGLDGWAQLVDSALGAFIGYAVFASVAFFFRQVRGTDGLGRGDSKLLAAGGAWVGWMTLPLVVLVASVLGVAFVIMGRMMGTSIQTDGKIAFGPFLAIGIWSGWCVAPAT